MKKFRPYIEFERFPEEEMVKKSEEYFINMKKRRTVRFFSEKEVPIQVIENCIKTAGRAPSGANMQPWHFAVVKEKALKRKIREQAEAIEKELYNGKASEEWLDDLEKLNTNAQKPFLEEAPYLIVVFAQKHGLNEDGSKKKHYYVNESVGLATGFLLTALHNAGLATLTYTPSPMGFLQTILSRPENEKAFMVIVTGYPKNDAEVPELEKKSSDDLFTIY